MYRTGRNQYVLVWEPAVLINNTADQRCQRLNLMQCRKCKKASFQLRVCALGQLATLHTEHDGMHNVCVLLRKAYLLVAEVTSPLGPDWLIFQLQSSARKLMGELCRASMGTAP